MKIIVSVESPLGINWTLRDMVYYFWSTDTDNDMSTKLHWHFAEGKYQIITSQKQCMTLRSQMKECIKKRDETIV